MKKYLYALSGALALAPSLVFAEGEQQVGPTVTTLVDPSQVQAQLTTALSNWVIVGIGIGISIFVVYLGWKLLRRFTK